MERRRLQSLEIFRKDAHHEEGVIADMAMDFAGPVARPCGGFGLAFIQHLGHLFERLTGGGTDLVHILDIHKIHEQIRDILDDPTVRPAQSLIKALLGECPEQPSDRVSFGDRVRHRSPFRGIRI